jgi:hypothetical protein
MAAPTIDELELADDPDRWASFGFVLDGGVCRLGSVDVRLGGSTPNGTIAGWALRDLDETELDGLPTRRSDRAIRAAAGEHPNGVLRIDHVVAMSPALDRTVAALEGAGLSLRRIREQPTPAGAPRQAFFRLGAEILEVVQEPPQAVARGGGPDRPAHFWGLAFLSTDLERTAAAFREHVGDIRPAVQPGRRIVTVKRSAGLAVPLALMSEDVPR